MIEVPRAALTAGEIARSAEFFSFGTNDLTQMTWAFSRDDVEGAFFAPYIDMGIFGVSPFETIDREGVGRLIKIAAAEGRATRPGLKLGICGEHGGDPAVGLVLPRGRPRLRVLLPVPRPGRPPGGGPRRGRKRRQRHPLRYPGPVRAVTAGLARTGRAAPNDVRGPRPGGLECRSGGSHWIVTYRPGDTDRWVAEPPKRAGRTEFQRDRARVLHSSALRRLAAKTQVVRAGSGDFPRTRLTHSLECAQIGRELGAALGCDPDLVDAACLAHDLGHPPFGHNGESALAALADPGGALACGGFEGNAQSLRLLTRLEPKVTGAGLNLTRATLDAALKYPWFPETRSPSARRTSPCSCRPSTAPTSPTLQLFEWIRAGAPGRRRCLEAQVMDWADDVAYSVHDVEDGLQAGLVSMKNLSDHSERGRVSAVALDHYCPQSWGVTAAELETVFAEFMRLDCWQFSFDGGSASLVAAKNLTSELVGRLCQAAQDGTRAVAGPAPLSRYAADLVVPRRQLLECALLKAVAAHYVMTRKDAVAQQAREREVITELALAIERRRAGHPRPGLPARLGQRGQRRGTAPRHHRPARVPHRHLRPRLARPPGLELLSFDGAVLLGLCIQGKRKEFLGGMPACRASPGVRYV